MVLDFQDKGKYFRGLLILIGVDKNIDINEKENILEICEKLGFESKFCNDAINGLLENQFIDKTPPIFSTKETAYTFLKDAINLSLVDNDFHTDELVWLEEVALANGISNIWLDGELKKTLIELKVKDKISV